MITVKELFKQIDRQMLCTEYLKLWSDISEDEYDELTVKLSSFIDKLLKIEATPCNGKIVLCHPSYMRYEDHSSPSSTVYYKDEILEYFTPIKCYDELDGYDLEKLSDIDIERIYTEFSRIMDGFDGVRDQNSITGRVNGYGYELSEWSDILGFYIPDYIVSSDDELGFAAAILSEMTFFGFDEDRKHAEHKILIERAEECEKISQLPAEEQQNYWISDDDIDREFGFADNRTDAEKATDELKFKRKVVLSEIMQYREIRRIYTELMK